MLAVIIYEVTQQHFNIQLAIVGLLTGFIVGILMSRRYRLTWDEETSKVIGRMDLIGAIILILYFVFVITRTIFLGYFIQGTALIVFIICISDGSMFGRILGTTQGVRKVLKAWNILD